MENNYSSYVTKEGCDGYFESSISNTGDSCISAKDDSDKITSVLDRYVELVEHIKKKISEKV